MVDRDDESEEFTEIPVGDLVVDLAGFEVRLPDGVIWSIEGDLDQGLIPEQSVRELSLSTVAEALGLLSERVEDGAPEGWYLETDPLDRMYDLELHDGLALESHGTDRLYVTVSIGLPIDADEVFERSVEELVQPMLQRAGAVGRRTRVSELFKHEVAVMVRYESMSTRTVADLINLGDDVRALLIAARSGKAHEAVAVSLVLGGHAAALVGQPESRWLDAKKQIWELGTPAGNAEAAKDLAAMANAQGGMILIPARTTVESGREVISEVRDMPVDRIDVTQLRDVLNQWVFPPLPDLMTEVVPTKEGRGRLLVAVGKHSPENWPHLVVGNPSSQFQNQAVSVWVRDADRNRALSAAELHALMSKRSSGFEPEPERAAETQ